MESQGLGEQQVTDRDLPQKSSVTPLSSRDQSALKHGTQGYKEEQQYCSDIINQRRNIKNVVRSFKYKISRIDVEAKQKNQFWNQHQSPHPSNRYQTSIQNSDQDQAKLERLLNRTSIEPQSRVFELQDQQRSLRTDRSISKGIKEAIQLPKLQQRQTRNGLAGQMDCNHKVKTLIESAKPNQDSMPPTTRVRRVLPTSRSPLRISINETVDSLKQVKSGNSVLHNLLRREDDSPSASRNYDVLPFLRERTYRGDLQKLVSAKELESSFDVVNWQSGKSFAKLKECLTSVEKPVGQSQRSAVNETSIGQSFITDSMPIVYNQKLSNWEKSSNTNGSSRSPFQKGTSRYTLDNNETIQEQKVSYKDLHRKLQVPYNPTFGKRDPETQNSSQLYPFLDFCRESHIPFDQTDKTLYKIHNTNQFHQLCQQYLDSVDRVKNRRKDSQAEMVRKFKEQWDESMPKEEIEESDEDSMTRSKHLASKQKKKNPNSSQSDDSSDYSEVEEYLPRKHQESRKRRSPISIDKSLVESMGISNLRYQPSIKDKLTFEVQRRKKHLMLLNNCLDNPLLCKQKLDTIKKHKAEQAKKGRMATVPNKTDQLMNTIRYKHAEAVDKMNDKQSALMQRVALDRPILQKEKYNLIIEEKVNHRNKDGTYQFKHNSKQLLRDIVNQIKSSILTSKSLRQKDNKKQRIVYQKMLDHIRQRKEREDVMPIEHEKQFLEVFKTIVAGGWVIKEPEFQQILNFLGIRERDLRESPQLGRLLSQSLQWLGIGNSLDKVLQNNNNLIYQKSQ